MSEIMLKVNEVAKEIKESVHVVRNWIRDFREYIPSSKTEAGYNLFDAESVKVIRTIQKLAREQKFTTRQIEHYLATGGDPFGIDAETEDRNKKLDLVLRRLDQQEEFQKMLLERLEEQNKHFEKFVHDRDEKLMLALREIGAARENSKKKWYQFRKK